MDRDAIEKICELQAEIDGYSRFIKDFLVSILKREHRIFVRHDETSLATEIETIWDEYDRLLDENDRTARDLKGEAEKK